MIVLMYKEACFNANELNSSSPSVVVSLLQDFEDVFPNDAPHGLPLIRGIEHQIYFIHDATSPNQSAYKNNLEDTKELQRQVEELMSKWYMRERMSWGLCISLRFCLVYMKV